MEGVFRFKIWFLNAPVLIHGGAYYRNFKVCHKWVQVADWVRGEKELKRCAREHKGKRQLEILDFLGTVLLSVRVFWDYF